MVFTRRVVEALGCLLVLVCAVAAQAAHGLSIDGELKYGPAFERFAYTSPDAVKGGELILHEVGGFDKMNPFTLKGTAPGLVQSLVYESLTESSLDEPFSQYGLLASDMTIAADRLSVIFVLDEAAKFSDGVPVTADDVVFSVTTLKSDQVHPFYPSYYNDIAGAEKIDERTIRISFTKINRELPLIAGQMPVFPRHQFVGQSFANRELRQPVGSGPYLVESFSQGRSVVYRRNPDYWAAEHPVRRHQFNFDRIVVKYYKDQTVALEAFKAGEFDVMSINIAKQWVRDLRGEKIDDGRIVKGDFAHRNNAGMQGFVMNTRRPQFQDPRVRRALTLAFDFEWTNRALFYDQYVRSHSFFSNSYLAATGLPTPAEMALLAPFRDRVPEEVFTTPLAVPRSDEPGGMRHNLQEAVRLLQQSGWRLQDGVMRNAQGIPLSFEIMLVSATFERVMAGYVENLKRIGVDARYRTIDPALYTERITAFDFDMCVFVFGQSQSPGNEQRNFWHSQAADRRGSRNIAGIKDPVVDHLVEKIIYAEDRYQLIAACRALDRVLWYGYYLVPNWYLDHYRIAYHNRFNLPETLPLYYSDLSLLMTWWKRD
ncbi:extracellular solute-binding protein [Desulfofustis limnaeus]|jgi:microcin C transport system substrate-binding protein|uniref:ABC transporter substrate-binding protein n=1 Tax=Desulfofustis limnaeus TaxID=2740163 RepID=A0ABM7W823_9BACT|nr:extracellular solute-binding protein [Desulfofustis limnaeus]MDX9894796.1 extracellular solute-binding protein [Desulfofustis sp.]BDD87144.1 ABC transporter substrate-binding protein [Desulfofustis limnaeus]